MTFSTNPSRTYKGATREGAKRAEAPPLATSIRKQIKYRAVLIFFVF